MDLQQLITRQAYPLALQERYTRRRLQQAYEFAGGKMYVSFSGGMDSLVVATIARDMFPDVPIVFFNTGLEYPEIVSFATDAFDNTEIRRPKMTFNQVVDKYGWPVVSKKVAQYVREARNAKGETATKRLRLTGMKSNGEYSPMGMIPLKWQYLIHAPFRCSEQCCDKLKKNPAKEYQKETGNMPVLGLRAAEGNQRMMQAVRHGCNAFHQNRPVSRPILTWSDAHVWEFVRAHGIKYSPIYDMGYTRTGRMFCMFGVHLETLQGPNRFQLMHNTHPKQWNYIMNKMGGREIMEYIKVPHEPCPYYQPDMFEALAI